MNAALTETQRSMLERLVGRARILLEEDLAAQASGRFGIDVDGSLAHEANLRLDPGALVARRELVAVVEYLHGEGEDSRSAVARLLREAVFTHLNRLVASRIAENLGLLPPSLSEGRRSQGFRDVIDDLAPLLAGDDTGGYWTYLHLCGDELAADIPDLFDPRNPLLALAPSPAALDDLVAMLADPAHSELWGAPDCLGWFYQFFNTGEERRRMRESSSAPRDSRELAVRNQFFTPRYVVEFLVQNSLGRRLLEANPLSPLLDDLPLLIDPPAEAGEPVDLTDVCVLDPAVGSGHFLLGAYDVLERAWTHAGVPPEEAAPNIVDALWGIDIDPRCTQVAAAAIIFRARRSYPTGALPRPNVVCARALPAAATSFAQFLQPLPHEHHHLIQHLTEALTEAPILGSLLKIEQRIATELRSTFVGSSAPGSLADVIPTEALKALEADVLTVLHHLADTATASPAERLFAAEADDAIRFVHALQRRYDAVVMNPPFGEPVPDTKPYLKAAYPWIPSRDHNLLAAFVGRGLELCRPGGYVGAITSRAGLFLKTFEDWRTQVLLAHHLVALADLGYGVMEQALVEAAAYVVGTAPGAGQHASFVRLLKDTNRPAGLADAVAAARAGREDPRVFLASLAELKVVPGCPIAYWMSSSIRRLFTDHRRLEGHGAEIRVGLQTGDDDRFVRAFWEVDPARIARSREETHQGKRWVPFAKGGEYSPYWADIHLVVNYANDGEEIRGFPGSVIRNPQYYFRPGLTWSRRTASGFAIRVLPSGCAFSDLGSSAFSAPPQLFQLGAYLSTRLVRGLLDVGLASGDQTSSGGAARHYNVGLVQNLPWPTQIANDKRAGEKFRQVAGVRAIEDDADETTRRFLAPSVLSFLRAVYPDIYRAVQHVESRSQQRLLILSVTHELEELCFNLLELDTDDVAYLDEEVGPHPTSYGLSSMDENAFARLYSTPIDNAIDEIIAAKGGARIITNLTYFADRRLEVLAHAFERPPEQLEEVRANLGLLPPEEPRASVEDLFSYLLGVAFGRWDVRIGSGTLKVDPEPSLFEPVSLCPPGMLVGDDGLPAREAPPGYPLDLTPDRLLLDQPGHHWDIEARVVAAASELFDNADAVVLEL